MTSLSPDICVQIDPPPFQTAQFRPIFAHSASTVRAGEKVQLALIGSLPRAFQLAIDKPCTLPLTPPKGGTKRDFAIFVYQMHLLFIKCILIDYLITLVSVCVCVCPPIGCRTITSAILYRFSPNLACRSKLWLFQRLLFLGQPGSRWPILDICKIWFWRFRDCGGHIFPRIVTKTRTET